MNTDLLIPMKYVLNKEMLWKHSIYLKVIYYHLRVLIKTPQVYSLHIRWGACESVLLQENKGLYLEYPHLYLSEYDFNKNIHIYHTIVELHKSFSQLGDLRVSYALLNHGEEPITYKLD